MKTDTHLTLIRWLAMVALFDWFVTRTVTRAAIFVPKPPPVIVLYEALNMAGQVALTLTGLLALFALGWVAWRGWQGQGIAGRMLALALAGQVGLSLLFLVIPPGGWLALAGHLFYLAVIALLLYPALWAQSRLSSLAMLLAALALVAGRLHQAIPTLYSSLQWPGPPPLTGLFFNLGELLVVASVFALWWSYGRDATWRVWLAAALPALAFAGSHLSNAAMTGILAVWSVGLTLYLPWPVYALSLWLAGVTVIAALRRDDPVGWAILLLLSGGYAPQLSLQAFLGLIALWLLAEATQQCAVQASEQRSVRLVAESEPVRAFMLRSSSRERV
ncbi:MAG: hypothetical protein DCC55_15600 [Chloroflexi bacterium]|nr:MAG: hypothetical protein DCC55_15600 [Chloroflexota bacterium]